MTEKILIVDDNEDMRALFSQFLLKKGYCVEQAENGEAGVKKTLTFSPDLILMDIVMPEGNGYEACKKIKLNPFAKDIPVIFLSSLNDTKDKLLGFDAGGADYFPKSGELSELLARIQAHLAIRSLTNALKKANEELMEKQKNLDKDLASAAIIQRSLLPSEERFSVANIDIAWECSPCLYVGGDIFNIIPINEEQIAVYMLDVSGHGVPSAMVSVSISQHLQELINRNRHTHSKMLTSPSQLLIDLDREFPLKRFDKFFTIFYMVIHLKTLKATYSLAGHPPAVLLHKDNPFELLKKGGAILGIESKIPFEEETIQLQKGDKIILYTDGVFEYENAQEKYFGIERFYDLLEANKNKPVADITEMIFHTLDQFGENAVVKDDISLLALSFKGNGAE